MAVRFGRTVDRNVDALSVSNEKLRRNLGDDYADTFTWFNESGFDVDLAAVRANRDISFSTLDESLRTNGWEG